MTLADRMFGRNLLLFNLATHELLAKVKDISVEGSADTVSNDAVQDSDEALVTKAISYTISGTFAVEVFTDDMSDHEGTEVDVYLEWGPAIVYNPTPPPDQIPNTAGMVGNEFYSGVGLLTKWKQTINDLQTAELELKITDVGLSYGSVTE